MGGVWWGMAGAPLRELTSHAPMARSAEMRCAGYARAGIGLHFRRFATFPQRRTRHPSRNADKLPIQRPKLFQALRTGRGVAPPLEDGEQGERQYRDRDHG